MPNHGLGYVPDKPDARDASFAVATLALAAGAPTADLRPYIVETLDQGTLPSCVAQALPGAIRIVEKREDPLTDPPLTSRFFCWYYSRLQHNDEKSPTGTYIRLAVKGLNALGRPPEELWPQRLDDLDVLPPERPTYAVKPPPKVSMAAYDKRKVKYHRITETGDARVAAVKAAVSAGMPVVFGTQVGWSFLADSGPTRDIGPPATGDFAGGHAMVIVAYDAAGCWILNSWGKGWRAGGLVHVSWEYVKWHRTIDLWGITKEAA